MFREKGHFCVLVSIVATWGIGVLLIYCIDSKGREGLERISEVVCSADRKQMGVRMYRNRWGPPTTTLRQPVRVSTGN